MGVKISVIIPVYNAEKYIRECLESVINQTYPELEILIIDDGSTDNSYAICKKYEEQDSRITVLHQENQGASVARNLGLKHVTGQYVGFVDSDDVLSVHMYETLLKGMQRYNANIGICNIQVFRGQFRTIDAVGKIRVDYVCEQKKELFKYALSVSQSVGNKLFDIRLFKNIQFPEGQLTEDGYIVYDLLYRSRRVYFSSLNGYYYRKYTGSSTTGAIKKQDMGLIHGNVRTYCRIKRIYPELTEDCLNRLLKNGFSEFTDKLSDTGLKLYLSMRKDIKKARNDMKYAVKDVVKSNELRIEKKILVCMFIWMPFIFYGINRLVPLKKVWY